MARGPAPASGSDPLPHQGAIQQAFGQHDFSDVRAHEQAKTIHANSVKYNPKADPKYNIGAEAYATGNKIAFTPGSTHGTSLLGHELTHVVQQGAPR